MTGRLTYPVLAALALLLLGGAGAVFYLNSDGYLARKALGEAAALHERGEIGAALERYASVADGATDHAAEARQRLGALSLEVVAAGPVAHALVALEFDARRRSAAVPGLLLAALEAAEARRDADLPGALGLATHVAARESTHREQALALRRELLVAAVAAYPAESGHAIELALILDHEGDPMRAAELLAPHRGALGTGEGARILGQADIVRGDNDAAYALLEPYVKVRLDEMRELESRYDTRYDELWDAEVDRLNEGQGPEAFYTAWNASDEERQQLLLAEYVDERLTDNAELESLRSRWREVSQVVPIALDVGTLMLYRAHSLADPGERQAQLEKAEAAFLAVQGVAGESNRFRRELGQVYYWLGRHDEGEALFDALLTDVERAPGTLLELSEIYRELGLAQQSFALAEEAFHGAEEDEVRYVAAHRCAMIAAELDEELKWLERSDPDDLGVQASLREARARKARADGDDESAAAHLREAIAIYGRQKPSGATSNNHALAAFDLHRIAPDREVLAEGRAQMILAVSLSPSNSIVLGNAVENLFSLGLVEFQQGEFDLAAMEWSPEYPYFDALWNTREEHAAVMSRYEQVPGISEAATYLAKALVLRPKDEDLYALARRFYLLRRNDEELARYAQLLRAADHDRGDYLEQALRYYKGELDDSQRERLAAEYQDWAGGFAEFAADMTSRQRSIALSEYLSSAERAARFGVKLDTRSLAETATSLDAAAPSRLTRDMLVDSLLLEAFQDLHEQSALDDVLAGCARCMGPPGLIALLAAERSALGERVRAHPATQRAAARLASDLDEHAGFDDMTHWALLSVLRPQAAAALAERLLAGRRLDAVYDIALLRNPAHPRALVEASLLARLRGDDQAAVGLMARFETNGLRAPAKP